MTQLLLIRANHSTCPDSKVQLVAIANATRPLGNKRNYLPYIMLWRFQDRRPTRNPQSGDNSLPERQT